MRIPPLPALRPMADRRRPGFWTRAALTGNSDIRGIVLGMIATNSLAAFTPGVAATPPVAGSTGVQQVRGIAPTGGIGSSAAPQQRTLEAVPPAPSKPMPRGSLLDLRV